MYRVLVVVQAYYHIGTIFANFINEPAFAKIQLQMFNIAIDI